MTAPKPCGCRVVHGGPDYESRFFYCPLHAAAGQMREALEAILARIDGRFDDPALIAQGALIQSSREDVQRIARAALALADKGKWE